MPKAKKTDKQRIYILDTNIFMADPDCMNRFGKHMIIVPDMVIEELDAIKRHLVTKAIIPDSLYAILTVCAAKEISSKVFPQKAVVLFVLHRITIMLYCLQAGKISRIIESCKLQKG